MLRDDYLMRMVRQLAEALARHRRAPEGAASSIRRPRSSTPPSPRWAASIRCSLRNGDAAVLLSLVQDPARREALARLLEERDALRAASAVPPP